MLQARRSRYATQGEPSEDRVGRGGGWEKKRLERQGVEWRKPACVVVDHPLLS